MKRILSFLISAILVIGTPISVYSSQEDTGIIEETSYEVSSEVSKSRELLASVGVVPPFSGSVTRADFVVALTALLKLDDASGEENCFYDVSADDSFNSSVNHALKLGIVSEGMYFRPNDFVTYAEACKMIAVTLGYASHAEAKGGYPYGYIAVASQIDIDTNVNVGAYDVLDADTAFVILANTLTADMLVADSVVYDNGEYMTGYGAVSNLMYVMHGLYKIEGIVGANDITNIYDFSAVCPDGFIMVGNTMYKSDYRPEPGTYITAYVEKTGQTETVRYLTYDESLTLTVYSGDMISFENRKLTYTDSDGREKTAVADYDFSAIYNGKAIADLTASDMDIDVGKIVLINSDNDGDYDVISIHSAVVSYIDLVNTDTSVAVDSFDGKTYELNDKDKYRIYSGGELVSASAVTKGSVIEIYATKDNSHVTINILNETINGTIKEKGENSLFVDSTEYAYSDYFNRRYMKNSDLESSNTFVLTECGKLAAPNQATESVGNLGYAYKFASVSGVDNRYLIKVFTEDGNHVEYEIAPKVRMNESAIINSSELYSYFVNNGETIVRYSTNADGKINAVIFPEAAASSTKDSIYVPGSDSKDILKPYVIEGLSESTGITYKIFGIFTPHFMISDETKIFCIDPDRQKDEERYTIGSTNTWGNDSTIPFGAMQIYNVTSIGRAGVLVVKHSVSSSLGASRELLGGVVESVSRSINADGDESVKLVLYGKGKYVNLFIPKGHNKYEQALTELDYGDFIVYSSDKNSNLLDYDKDFDCSSGDILHSSGGDNDGLSYYYGTLDEADETAFSIDLIDSSTATKSKMCVVVREDGGITSLANVDRGVISGLAYSQLSNYKQQGYEVLVRTYCAEPFQIVVYKR